MRNYFNDAVKGLKNLKIKFDHRVCSRRLIKEQNEKSAKYWRNRSKSSRKGVKPPFIGGGGG